VLLVVIWIERLRSMSTPEGAAKWNYRRTRQGDSIFQLVGSALERIEESQKFRDHMRRLSNSFASMRAFQDDLGVLAESFEPVKALHQ
jgi:hypothetical protein